MSPLPPDPYLVLGVPKHAQIPEIRSAHRKLVLKCHPDKVQDPTLKAQKQDEFQKVQQAYEILSDDKERQKYDDLVRFAELRKQYQSPSAKPNSASPRTTKFTEYDIRTPEPRAEPRSFKAPNPSPPGVGKQYFPHSYDENTYSRSPHSYQEQPEIRTPRREQSYREDKAHKRESERERDIRDKEKEKELRRKARREEKAAEEAKREEKERKREAKRQRDKSRSKELRHGTEDKLRSKVPVETPYIESYEEDLPIRSEKKKSGSRKHEERRDREHEPRDRSAHREEPAYPYETPSTKGDFARAYIKKAQGIQSDLPAAPTPPPAGNTPFAPPPVGDDEVRRSAARPRRDSADGPGMPRERSFHKSSREHMDDEPTALGTSPRHVSYSGTTPPRGVPSRHNTMPTSIPEHDTYHPRAMPIPAVGRSATFGPGGYDNVEYSKGRTRSRMYSQEPVEIDSDEEYETSRRREKDRKHRSSRKTPERSSSTTYYKVGKTGSSKIQYEDEGYDQYYGRSSESRRPPIYARESSYTASYPKVSTSRSYTESDILYSPYGDAMRATA